MIRSLLSRTSFEVRGFPTNFTCRRRRVALLRFPWLVQHDLSDSCQLNTPLEADRHDAPDSIDGGVPTSVFKSIARPDPPSKA
jgi:hypothetical protein